MWIESGRRSITSRTYSNSVRFFVVDTFTLKVSKCQIVSGSKWNIRPYASCDWSVALSWPWFKMARQDQYCRAKYDNLAGQFHQIAGQSSMISIQGNFARQHPMYHIIRVNWPDHQWLRSIQAKDNYGLPKKGTRELVINNQKYLWYFNAHCPLCSSKAFTIGQAGKRFVLFIDPYPWNFDLRPESVVSALRWAFERNWSPWIRIDPCNGMER